MSYDPETVLSRYQQLLDQPEGEPTESLCALAQERGAAHETLGCSSGACASCCVGLVEVVRQFSERQVGVETRTLDFADTTTKAQKLDSE